MTAFDRFRTSLPPADQIHDGLIGTHAEIEGPFGPKKMIYADYVASGRAHMAIERFVLEEVLPWYANSHTEASFCGAKITRMREDARAEILRCVNGQADHAVVFTGSGATAALNRLAMMYQAGPGTTVITGPYEHHSNILPWRESGATVIEIPEAPNGGPDEAQLESALAAADGPVIATFSAASNVTGILSDVKRITQLCKRHGAKVIWDYAGGAPYLPIDMSLGMDAVAVSPHKFIGGPGASGVLIVRRGSVERKTPTLPGGGTVIFVNDRIQDYSARLEDREEGGTPNVVGDIRAALVFALKDAAGQAYITDRNRALWEKAKAAIAEIPQIELLGNLDADRLPIVSFVLHGQNGKIVHHTLTTQMLSDAYGVQARGGCACAGPYVHHLLHITAQHSDAMRTALLGGEEMKRPGFVRLNLCWAAPDHEIDQILTALKHLAQDAPKLARRYSCDASRARFTPMARDAGLLRRTFERLRGIA